MYIVLWRWPNGPWTVMSTHTVDTQGKAREEIAKSKRYETAGTREYKVQQLVDVVEADNRYSVNDAVNADLTRRLEE